MQAGLLDTFHQPMRTRQWPAWVMTAVLTISYILLYFGPRPRLGITIDVFETIAAAAGLPSKWVLCGLLYSIAMVAGGAYMLKRHGNSPYQRVRTVVVVLVQIVLAFALPIVLQVFWNREFYFSYFWPLKIEYFYPGYILQQPFLMIAWSFLGSLIAFPILAFYFGKRFYCSWICGCGGLANTAGEPFRHLSDKSKGAWQVERFSIYSVFALSLITTAIVWLNWAVGQDNPRFAQFAFKVQEGCGFAIGAMFSGPVCQHG